MAFQHQDNTQYYIMNCASRTMIDLNNGSASNGTRCQGWDHNYHDVNTNQLWKLESYVENGGTYYYLKNNQSGTYMDLNNGSSENGTQIQGWTFSKGLGNQLWQFEDANPGAGKIKTWKIKDKAFGTYVDLNNGSNTNGIKLQGWDSTDSFNGQWVLIQST